MSKQDAPQTEMKSAIREFGDNIVKGDVALFYYAGHGAQVNGENYLIPVNEGLVLAQMITAAYFHLWLKFAGSSVAPERVFATRAITKSRSERRLR